MAVVAQSLASLTNLAANPPLYPHNPTERPSDPLTLYIVKVPGSRDVFLTPLKPRDKVVSANDVQSSLYFLHVDTDAAYEHEIRLQQQRSRANSATHGTVVRKPLPTPPTSPDTEYPSDFRIPSPLPHRKPLPASASLSAPQHSYGDRTSFDTSAPIDLGGLSLTLIRRDPSSGAQWNVAKIWDPPVPDISSDSYNDTNQTFSRAQATGTPLYLELENPGYVRFNQMEGSRPLSRDSRSNPSLDPNAALTDGRFRRRLYMEGSRYTDHTYTHRKASSDISVFDMYRPPLQQQRLSTQSIPRPSVDRRSKGYAFMSPWGGKCSFSTGASGRSLKVGSPPVINSRNSFHADGITVQAPRQPHSLARRIRRRSQRAPLQSTFGKISQHRSGSCGCERQSIILLFQCKGPSILPFRSDDTHKIAVRIAD